MKILNQFYIFTKIYILEKYISNTYKNRNNVRQICTIIAKSLF